MTVTEVANALGLSAIKNRKYQIFKTSAIKGDGLDEAMEWYVSRYVDDVFLLLVGSAGYCLRPWFLSWG